ncbi:MAG: formyltransferase family protein [Candidatus Sulfotelmatobacter sp.]
MRIVVLCSSEYSETACAMAVRMAKLGHVPVGALALSTLDGGTLLRKLGQWGVEDVIRYARAKLIPHRGHGQAQARNPYLQPLLKQGEEIFRSLREVANVYGFSVAVCRDQNAPDSIARLKEWSPDLIIFTGGNILRKQLLEVPRLGVLNVHLGLLPEVRGMSSPEWSLLNHVPVGVTIHYVDAGIDTGPLLQRYEFPDVAGCESLSDLRNRLIAFGLEKAAEVIAGLDQATISATAQSHRDEDRQFFVMHEWLQARAAERLTKSRRAGVAGTING